MEVIITICIKTLRKHKGLTQAELAELSGIQQSMLSLIESGKRTPSVRSAQRIAAALGVEWTKFFEPINRQEEQSLETKRQAM